MECKEGIPQGPPHCYAHAQIKCPVSLGTTGVSEHRSNPLEPEIVVL